MLPSQCGEMVPSNNQEHDITPRSIAQGWSRVSTVHTETGLEGMRVAAMTGTELDDIAVALTMPSKPHSRQRFDAIVCGRC